MLWLFFVSSDRSIIRRMEIDSSFIAVTTPKYSLSSPTKNENAIESFTAGFDTFASTTFECNQTINITKSCD